MATQAKGKVSISGRFSPGTTVELHERGSADVYAGGNGGKVASAKTDKNGVTSFEAPPGNYFAVATEKVWNHVTEQHEDRLRQVDVTIARPAAPAPDAPLPLGPEPPAEHFLDNAEIVVGARSSVDGNATVDRALLVDKKTGAVSEFALPVGTPTPKADVPEDPPAATRIEDASGPLASSTLTGEAVAPREQSPPLQEDSGKTQQQASDTEAGVQAEALETLRQEDVPKATRQASATETGTATPLPQQPKKPAKKAAKKSARKRSKK